MTEAEATAFVEQMQHQQWETVLYGWHIKCPRCGHQLRHRWRWLCRKSRYADVRVCHLCSEIEQAERRGDCWTMPVVFWRAVMEYEGRPERFRESQKQQWESNSLLFIILYTNECKRIDKNPYGITM